MVHDHAWLTCNGTVAVSIAQLVWAHCPAGIRLVRRDGNEIGVISRKLASCALDEGWRAGRALNGAPLMMQMSMSAYMVQVMSVSVQNGSFGARREEDNKRGDTGLQSSKLHRELLSSSGITNR